MRPQVLMCAITVAAGTLLLTPAGVRAAKLTCLTGTDPSVTNDLPQIAVVRTAIDAACPCESFDGSKGKTHANYVTCVSGVISTQVSTGNLRNQCKTTVKKYYSISTCGVPASKGNVPCIKTSAAGKVTCAIKSSTKCTGTPCASFSTCIDAADTNADGIINSLDSGACAASVTHERLVDNGDGTITDTQTGLMWEKKDQAGSLDDEDNVYVWAGGCSDDNDPCQPDAGAVVACAAAAGGAGVGLVGCTLCGGTGVTCLTGGTTTIWHWLNQLNAAGLGGHSDWRIPTVGQDGGAAQLETILAEQYPNCTSSPCVPPVFNSNCAPGCTVDGNGGPICSCTPSGFYWSASTYTTTPQDAWGVNFYNGGASYDLKSYSYHVRAVR